MLNARAMVLAIVGVAACGGACERPLAQYCAQCPTLEEATDVVDLGLVEPGGSDVWLYQCDGYSVLTTALPYNVWVRNEYYRGGVLVGVGEWNDSPHCGFLNQGSTVSYGEVLPWPCGYCTLERWCATENCAGKPMANPCAG